MNGSPYGCNILSAKRGVGTLRIGLRHILQAIVGHLPHDLRRRWAIKVYLSNVDIYTIQGEDTGSKQGFVPGLTTASSQGSVDMMVMGSTFDLRSK